MRTSERRRLVARMPAATQAEVWSRHLLRTLVEHPEFTTEQRAVIQEALLLLTPELFEIGSSDPRWQERVDRPLRALTHRIIAAFPDHRGLMRELFTQLGPDVAASEPRGKRSPVAQSEYPDCTCSVVSDWCSFGECRNHWCVFTSSGCGTFFRYACEGECLPT
ncbi:MAG TPA: bacteriocin fulvocin C-related protein [Thermoanaerobaculia bacterium]|nr:bacteriocin fulvocin C-related protein [Thermoanaerobaculia bacterium]